MYHICLKEVHIIISKVGILVNIFQLISFNINYCKWKWWTSSCRKTTALANVVSREVVKRIPLTKWTLRIGGHMWLSMNPPMGSEMCWHWKLQFWKQSYSIINMCANCTLIIKVTNIPHLAQSLRWCCRDIPSVPIICIIWAGISRSPSLCQIHLGMNG